MMNDFKIPFGLCQIEYGELSLIQGENAIFEASPTYEKMYGGAISQTQGYILAEYDVSLTISFDKENYDILTLHYPTLKHFEEGLIDNASKVDMSGKRLSIRPLGEDSKDYDITMFDAYIEPTDFNRTYGKQTDTFEVTFKGKPKTINNKLSWFFIGDFDNLVGVSL